MLHRLVSLFALILAVSCLPCQLSAETKRPNILIIVGDDMGYADVGFHGCRDIPTPNLEALSTAGVKFTNGYVSGPYCSPTRAGLLTGRYQTRFGHEYNPGAGAEGLPLSETTLADRLKAAGYQTGLVGKWHLGGSPDRHPLKRGFDEFYGFLGGAHDYFAANGILRDQTPEKQLDYTTDAFGREAVAFIERHRSKPWFLYLAFNAVHTPLHAKEEHLTKFASIADKQRRTYAGMMFAMDEALGKVRAKLAETGQAENTLIAFISDNGGPVMRGVTVNGANNAPLRGSKRTTLEGGVRVPFLLAWPGKIKPAVYDQPAIQLDLHATALAAAGIELKSEWKLDGVNLLPYVNGEKSGAPHESLFWRFGEQMAIRSGDWKLVRYDLNADAENKSDKKVSEAMLYNLAQDIHEDKNLASEHPEKLKELQSQWDRWNQANTAPLWGRDFTTPTGDKQPAEKKGKKKAKTAVE
jgi:arylsulfatase A-like enzyme